VYLVPEAASMFGITFVIKVECLARQHWLAAEGTFCVSPQFAICLAISMLARLLAYNGLVFDVRHCSETHFPYSFLFNSERDNGCAPPDS